MFILAPTSALRYNYPTCRGYTYDRAAETAVHHAAYDYALAHARAEAVRQREQEQRYLEAVRREQIRRRAEVVELVEAIYEQQYPQYRQHAYGHPFFDAAQYHERLQVEAARRRAELLRQRQEAEQARSAAAARQRAEAERRRDAARRDQEHWVSLLNSQFGPQKPEPSPARPAESAPQPSTSSVESALKHRLAAESDSDVLETLQRLLWSLEPTPSQPVDKKGKARETPAVPFSFPKAKPEEKKVHFEAPTPANPSASSHTPSAPAPGPKSTEEPPQSPAPAALERSLSLNTIERIEDSLHTLQSAFVLPSELDLAPSPASASGHESDSETDLAFTSKNKPVHAYEHALNGLLESLDAVESYGDEEIRGRRKAVVGLVEGALKEVGKRVEESRERERKRNSVVEVEGEKAEESVKELVDPLVEEVAATPAGAVVTTPAQEAIIDTPAVDDVAVEAPPQDVVLDVEAPSTLPKAEAEANQTVAEDGSTPTAPTPNAEASVQPIEATNSNASTPAEDVAAPSADAHSHVQEAVVEGPATTSLPTDSIEASPAPNDAPSTFSDIASPQHENALSTPSSPSPDAESSFLLQPSQNPLPDPAPRSTPSEHEEDAELVSVSDVSDGELKEWESVASDGEL